ncbi:SEA (Seh1-associated) complex subunit [Trapelia coarctata]|nr:SEA (Seh1-associated) complex subunit [Trapelia coarctata]
MSASFRTDAPKPPPPPPLPPQRYGARAATAIARLAQPFFYGSRPPSAQGHRGDEAGIPAFRSDIPRSSGSSSSHSLVHKTGISIAALDISPDRAHAILAGREILKTIRVQGATCSKDFNLRSTIIAYASTHNLSRGVQSAQHRDQLAANDVKWSHGKFDTTIATAAANGRIVLYDLNRAGVELARLHEHTRQVHKICFNPHQGALLLSGSQDATIRMWDIRVLAGDRSVMTCRSHNKFSGNNEGIRDVRWSPTDGVEFAAGTDNGVIQRWDIRKENAPLIKINAHDKTCHSIDWHPSGKYLASAGADKNVKVWDFKSTDRRMKPSWQLRAPQAVLNARWRPLGGFREGDDISNHQSTFLATSYDQHDPRVHIWDFRRPHVPYKEFDRYETPATGMLWCNEDLLWSVSSAGMFTQTDIYFWHKPIERRSINVATTGPDGQICFFSKARARRPMALADAPLGVLRRTNTGGSSGENFGSSRSGTDGSLEEPGMLTSSIKRRRQKSMSTQATGSTPPYAAAVGAAAIRLEEAMGSEGKFHHDQVAAFGYVTGVFDVDAFKYLARHYQPPLSASAFDRCTTLHETMISTFERNAILATHTGQYRLAQSWRILGLAAGKELENRAERSLKCRTSRPICRQKHNYSIDGSKKLEITQPPEKQEFRKPSPIRSNYESTSNMPTPLVRPVQESSSNETTADDALDLNDPTPAQMLGPEWKSKQSLVPYAAFSQQQDGPTQWFPESMAFDAAAERATLSNARITPHGQVDLESFAEIEQEMDERRAAMNSYRARPRPILRLDEPTGVSRNLSVMPRLDRHDSDESFQMFSASSDSGPRSMSLAGSFGESHRSNTSDPTPELWGQSPSTRKVPTRLQEAWEEANLSPHAGSMHDSEVDSSKAYSTVRGPDISAEAPTGLSSIRRPTNTIRPKIHVSGNQESKNETVHEDHTSFTSFIPTDFTALDSAAEDLSKKPLPWSATALIPSLLDFHLNALSDTQFPTFLILYLRSLFPSAFDPDTASDVLLSYHQKLVSLSLFTEAAALRNYCYPTYPDVWQLGIGDNRAAGFYCMTCAKAVKGDTVGFCKRCKQEWGLCPICESRYSPLPFPSAAKISGQSTGMGSSDPPLPSTKLWAWCQECGHGGHDSCLRVWFSDPVSSEGGCPCQGCLHDCMPGIRRDERMKELAAEAKKAKLKAGGVVKDVWVVGESRAVERTRGLVAGDTKLPEMSRTLSGKSGPLSAGLGSGPKKVRVVEPVGGSQGGEDVLGGEEQAVEEATSRSEP